MAPVNVLMVGTGEYTTGYVGGTQSTSDKKVSTILTAILNPKLTSLLVGVVGLTMFDLRRRGKVGKLSMVGTSGNKFPGIRKCSPRPTPSLSLWK